MRLAVPFCLCFLVDTGSEALQKEMQLSIQAGDLVGKIYDAIRPQYAHSDDPDTLALINQLCVRLVFCLFAEDAGLFGDKNEFHDYLLQFPAQHLRRAHQANDRAVMAAYGFPTTMSESDCVARLLEMYQQINTTYCD